MTLNVVVADFKQHHEIPIATDDPAVARAAVIAIREAISAGYAAVSWTDSRGDDNGGATPREQHALR